MSHSGQARITIMQAHLLESPVGTVAAIVLARLLRSRGVRTREGQALRLQQERARQESERP